FDVNPFDEQMIRHATALFEFRKGRWLAEGKHVDALRPDEALLRHRRYEPVTPRERAVSFADLDPHLRPELDIGFEVELRRPADFEQRSFHLVDRRAGLGHTVGD